MNLLKTPMLKNLLVTTTCAAIVWGSVYAAGVAATGIREPWLWDISQEGIMGLAAVSMVLSIIVAAIITAER